MEQKYIVGDVVMYHNKIMVVKEPRDGSHFDPKPPTKEVLDKYNITDKEYYNICNELEDKLCVGSCGWCIYK